MHAVYNLYTDNIEFLAINGLFISSSSNLGPTSSSSFTYADKVMLTKSKDLGLD